MTSGMQRWKRAPRGEYTGDGQRAAILRSTLQKKGMEGNGANFRRSLLGHLLKSRAKLFICTLGTPSKCHRTNLKHGWQKTYIRERKKL